MTTTHTPRADRIAKAEAEAGKIKLRMKDLQAEFQAAFLAGDEVKGRNLRATWAELSDRSFFLIDNARRRRLGDER
jgi:hypothetical protein